MRRSFTLPLVASAAGGTGGEDPAARFIRLLTVFLLAMWVGFEVITKVPQRLHTPLTSGSNAISGIIVVGDRRQGHRLELGHGRHHPRAAHLAAEAQQLAGGLLGRVLERDRPARCLLGEAGRVLQA